VCLRNYAVLKLQYGRTAAQLLQAQEDHSKSQLQLQQLQEQQEQHELTNHMLNNLRRLEHEQHAQQLRDI
jgi:hypothetical protein